MKKIVYILASFILTCYPLFANVAPPSISHPQPKVITLSTNFIGFAFADYRYQVAELRFFYSASPTSNSDKSSQLKLSYAKFKFRGKYYNLYFQIHTRRNIEADIVAKTSGKLALPIGHLSLHMTNGQLLSGSMKIYPETNKYGKKDKEGSGDFSIDLNLVDVPKWSDLNKTKGKNNWAR